MRIPFHEAASHQRGNPIQDLLWHFLFVLPRSKVQQGTKVAVDCHCLVKEPARKIKHSLNAFTSRVIGTQPHPKHPKTPTRPQGPQRAKTHRQIFVWVWGVWKGHGQAAVGIIGVKMF